ncbi:MAG: DUF3841 domain-containing protein [Bacteroidaceae bacterium]|nr:DUF3841 domain-containing protein [Bacteroidaceae bacterium]
MRLWTLQGIEIYEQLQRDGIAYCTKPSWADEPQTLRAYHWMADQMRRRIGEPPIKGIEFPMWAWYQYNSAKSNKPPRSLHDADDGLSAYMEIEIQDNEVLLSDFSSWHSVLNEGPIDDWKRIWRQMERLEKEAGRRMTFDDYPLELQKEIEKSWEGVFDLDRGKKEKYYRHRRNLSIQATFWALKPEHVVSVEILEKKGNVIKRIQ